VHHLPRGVEGARLEERPPLPPDRLHDSEDKRRAVVRTKRTRSSVAEGAAPQFRHCALHRSARRRTAQRSASRTSNWSLPITARFQARCEPSLRFSILLIVSPEYEQEERKISTTTIRTRALAATAPHSNYQDRSIDYTDCGR
jgi:hypothetical protein